MSTPIAIAMARFSAWQTMIARNVWLHLSSFPEAVRKDILEGPISPDGLFGPHFQHLVKEMQTASEESEKIHHHVMAPSHSAVIFLTTNFISGGRFSTSSTCPPRQQHHIADLPSLASWLFYGLALRRSLPGSRGDSDRLGGERCDLIVLCSKCGCSVCFYNKTEHLLEGKASYNQNTPGFSHPAVSVSNMSPTHSPLNVSRRANFMIRLVPAKQHTFSLELHTTSLPAGTLASGGGTFHTSLRALRGVPA
ncbi:hypothetical protein EXN66_Car008178 [Channa argus]|uniref:Uncharacterized protein n=1 Tax=Channa argus TaxID=215402 RepID=A0A6G1PQG1_CHAAH|nr:hypothetical protein EXN66_Car008178 [Channa argus]